jgi:hypothetical protein
MQLQFLREQNWKMIDGKLVQKEKDHMQVIGYDASITLSKTLLI